MLEFIFGWARIIFIETLPNNMWWCRCCLIIFSEGFLTPKLNLSLQFSSCGPWRVFSHSNSPPHRALGWYRHTSSSRQIHYILCWLEILNYCPDGGNGYFHYSNLWSSIIFCCTSEIYSLFFLIVMMIKGVWALFSLLYISVKQVMAG